MITLYIGAIFIHIAFSSSNMQVERDTIRTDSIYSVKDSHHIENVPTDTLFVLFSENHTTKSEDKQYTIQICTMSSPLSDSFFKGQYGIKLIKTGDLYRYIFSMYSSVEEARKDLPMVRKIYPDAFIREYSEEKLGKAIDLNIDHIK